MEPLKIVALCVGSAILYGILHDQVTARICVEYFTIGHPPIFGTESPTLLAFGWGVLATWWVGLFLAIPAALACRAGAWPKLGAGALVRPLAVLLLVMGCLSALAGLVGHDLASAELITLAEPLRSDVPAAKHVAFLTDGAAHSAAYAVGFVGGLVLCARVVFLRHRLAREVQRAPAEVQ